MPDCVRDRLHEAFSDKLHDDHNEDSAVGGAVFLCSEQLRRVSEEEVCRPGKTVSVLQMSYNFGTDFGTKRQVGKSTGNICLMESGYIHKVTKRQKKRTASRFIVFKSGRGGEIRTHGLLYPKQARYQAAPRPDVGCCCIYAT